MKKFLLLAVLCCSFLLPQNVFACSCADFPNTFCGSVRDDINIAKMRVLEKFDFDYDGHIYPMIKVAVNDLIRGATPMSDTFFLIGQDGLNCNESLNPISIDEEIVVGFFNDSGWIPEGAEEELNHPILDLFGCGRYYLKISGDMVEGPIRPGVDAVSYAEFRSGIENCVDFISNAPSPNELNAEARFSLDGQLSIRTDRSAEASLQLYNAAGQLIRNENIWLPSPGEDFRWSMPDLASGLYFLNIQTTSGRSVVKIVRS